MELRKRAQQLESEGNKLTIELNQMKERAEVCNKVECLFANVTLEFSLFSVGLDKKFKLHVRFVIVLDLDALFVFNRLALLMYSA